jgi:murein DD-endopeptidase MepM/ murein hydrolase activator NlpD
MAEPTRTPSTAPRRAISVGLLVVVLCAWTLVAGLLPAAAQTDEDALRAELEQGEAEQARVAESLTAATARLDDLTGRMAQIRDRADQLRAELQTLSKRGARAEAMMTRRLQEMYKGHGTNGVMAFATGTSLSEMNARTHYVAALARNDRTRLEEATALVTATQARRDELAQVDERMSQLVAEAEDAQAELDTQFAQAGQFQQQLRDELAQAEAEARRLAAEAEAKRRAAEEAARDAAREDAARELAAAEAAERRAEAASRSVDRARAEVAAAPAPAPAPPPAPETAPAPPASAAAGSTGSSSGSSGSSTGSSGGSSGSSSGSSGGSSGSSGGSSSGKACPQANPRSFTDTWGAPRSGGRTHQGTDIFGARGGDVFAIVSGRVEWTSTGSTSGLFLSLRGNDGHTYWYMHLQDFVARAGQTVQAGQLIAHNGDTGNARGTTPHIHFEYHPGGGSAVNPYPMLKAVCG